MNTLVILFGCGLAFLCYVLCGADEMQEWKGALFLALIAFLAYAMFHP